MSDGRVRILSVDGGGIRGIVPATVLADLERRAQRPVAELFDLVARATEDPDRDYAIADAALATASAPTYFEPVVVRSAAGTYSALIDGGVFAVNPAMCAYAEARRGGAAPDVLLVSLGTGQLTRPIPFEEAKDWGLLEWARPLIDVVFDGSSDVVDYQLRQLLGASFHRFQVTLDTGSDDLDDASASNMRLLREKGDQLVAEHDAELDELVAQLTG
jgi:uncharacterized protein